MFEVLLLLLFFGLVLWFLAPEGRPAPQRHRAKPVHPPVNAEKPTGRSPQAEAERWFHSGRR